MVRSQEHCPICRKSAKFKAGATTDHIVIDCRDCGLFGVSEPFREAAPTLAPFNRRLALNHARDRARYGVMPIITNYDVP